MCMNIGEIKLYTLLAFIYAGVAAMLCTGLGVHMCVIGEALQPWPHS
jgi:hypothetical protein